MRFQFIDSIVELEPGKRVVAIRDVNPDEDYFQDHFPGFPVVPGIKPQFKHLVHPSQTPLFIPVKPRAHAVPHARIPAIYKPMQPVVQLLHAGNQQLPLGGDLG